jgi:ParB-like chromosome segregation protein Spo0J
MKIWPADQVERRAVAALIPSARNARTHSDAQVAQIAGSIREWGWTIPVLIDEEGGIIAGHGRVLAAQLLGLDEVPAMTARGWSDAQKRAYMLADNKLALNAGWDEEMLKIELTDLMESLPADLMGFDEGDLKALFGEIDSGTGSGVLMDRFGEPPFSVLNAREGRWQARKRAWVALGIQSELGRTEDVLFRPLDELQGQLAQGRRNASPGGSPRPAADYGKSHARGDGAGRAKVAAGRTFGAISNFDQAGRTITGTSVFDPVLCELAYRWFSPPGGMILDPFAGGSVRGIVAGRLGRAYHGFDLRPEQIAANEEQARAILTAEGDAPVAWRCGDSLQHLSDPETPDADMVFSCPPYADLERYSDDPADLSNMPWPEFLAAYRGIIAKACARLLPDRFACFVVGEVRDPQGIYRDFVGETVAAFQAAGLGFYNEAILVTAVGSLPVRAGKQFSTTRKLGKTHQNVLVFIKGDPRAATAACGEVEVDVPEPDPDPEDPESFGEPL